MVGQGNLPSTWITKFSSRITTCLSNVHNGYGHPWNLNDAQERCRWRCCCARRQAARWGCAEIGFSMVDIASEPEPFEIRADECMCGRPHDFVELMKEQMLSKFQEQLHALNLEPEANEEKLTQIGDHIAQATKLYYLECPCTKTSGVCGTQDGLTRNSIAKMRSTTGRNSIFMVGDVQGTKIPHCTVCYEWRKKKNKVWTKLVNLHVITEKKLESKKGRVATQGVNLRKTLERRDIQEIGYESIQLLCALDEKPHRRMCVITRPELLQSMKNFESYMWVCLTKSRTSTSLLLSSVHIRSDNRASKFDELKHYSFDQFKPTEDEVLGGVAIHCDVGNSNLRTKLHGDTSFRRQFAGFGSYGNTNANAIDSEQHQLAQASSTVLLKGVKAIKIFKKCLAQASALPDVLPSLASDFKCAPIVYYNERMPFVLHYFC